MPVLPELRHGSAMIDQAGTIPFRLNPNGGLELLLVTSKSGSRWVFPKGRIERGRTGAEQAILETYEEAGVLGDLLLPGIGSYSYAKNGATHLVQMFLLQVDRVLDRWPEAAARHRSWLPLEAALSIQGRNEARIVCRGAVARLHDLANSRMLYSLGSISIAAPDRLTAAAG